MFVLITISFLSTSGCLSGKVTATWRLTNPITTLYFKLLYVLKHTTFFKAFTASATIPSIYIQQFWNTICYDRATDTYKCQLDDQWVNITKETLGSALQILPTGDNVEYTPRLIQPPYYALSMNWDIPLKFPHYPRSSLMICTNHGGPSRVSLTCV